MVAGGAGVDKANPLHFSFASYTGIPKISFVQVLGRPGERVKSQVQVEGRHVPMVRDVATLSGGRNPGGQGLDPADRNRVESAHTSADPYIGEIFNVSGARG